MTEAEGGEAAAVETTPEAAPEISSVETEARKQGWRPLEEWAGDPDNWKDAKTYVEHGDLKNRLSKMEKDFERLSKMSEKTVEKLKRQHANEVEQLKAERRAAVKAGNVEAVEQYDAAIETLKQADPVNKNLSDEEVQGDWIKKNAWFEDDEDMRVAAIGYSQSIRRDDLSMAANLERVDAYMRKKFPEKFGEKKAAANGHAAVDGGGNLSGIIPRKDTLTSKLSNEARAQAKKDVEAGLYKNTEEWAKVYLDI